MASPGEIPTDEDTEKGPESQPKGASASAYKAQQDDATESEPDEMDMEDESQEEPVAESGQPHPDETNEEESNDEEDEHFPQASGVTDKGSAADENAEMEESENAEDQLEEEVDSSTKDESESVARSSRSITVPTYSTRGRYQKEEDPLEALLAGVRAQGDEERELITAAAPATSFLDSLSEEDRRTRTRHLPDVEGFHPLYKSEVKSDLSLARSVMSSAGVTSKLISSRRPSKSKKPQKDEEQMDVEDEGTGPSEDERASEAGAPVIELDQREFSVPSKVFVAPKNADGDEGSISSTKQPKNKTGSPFVVEAITAFNPPRPPESVGAKKKHRLLRWERRPQDVDVDLNNYKKTVRRTREELRNAEKERERIQTFGAILRVHFRDHLELLNEESLELNEELGSIQTECVSAADLLTSRTRSRGAGKGSYLMRDVISVLKARGTELVEKGFPVVTANEAENGVPGFGGVTSFGFIDWDKSTDVPVQKLAIGWTLPGDKVSTQYGDGVALFVFGPSILNVNEALPIDLRPKPTPSNGNKVASPNVAASAKKASEAREAGEDEDVVMEIQTTPKEVTGEEEKQNNIAEVAGAVKSSEPAPAAKESEENVKQDDNTSKPTPEKIASTDIKKEYHMDQILAPRVCVQLCFGVGFFPVSEVKSKGHPACYSDAKLAWRWKKMIETSELVGSCLDVAGMESVVHASTVDRDYKIQSSMEIDDESENNASGTEAKVTSNETLDKAKHHTSEDLDGTEDLSSSERFVPYGACLLPTDAGRGSLTATAPLTALEPPIHEKMFHACGALGNVCYTCVPCSLNPFFLNLSLLVVKPAWQSRSTQARKDLGRHAPGLVHSSIEGASSS